MFKKNKNSQVQLAITTWSSSSIFRYGKYLIQRPGYLTREKIIAI